MAFDDDFNWWHRPTKRVEGGIKARSRRFGESWWSARWLDVLLSMARSSGRLARGRSYARRGQITDFNVAPGAISGSIQGSADEPYLARIELPPLESEVAERILRQMQKSPLFAARLLNQEMPQEAETLFEQERVLLYPESMRFSVDCTCPDEATICKHVAALGYLFSLELERDPLLMLQFRGIDRNRLMSEVRTSQSLYNEDQEKEEPLSADPVSFWRGMRVSQSTLKSNSPDSSAGLVKQLGPFPRWRGETDLAAFFEAAYSAATSRALECFQEDSVPEN